MPSSPRRTWRMTPVVIALSVIGLLLAAGAWWQLLAAEGASPTPAPTDSATTSPVPEPTPVPAVQQTLLVQVLDGQELAQCNVTMGVAGQPERAAFLWAPPGLLVDAGSAGEVALARTVLLADTLAAQRALGTTLGLRIDGTLAMERLAFAGLVDAVDGVTVQVDGVPVDLAGAEAADYVTARAPDEPEADRIRRCAAVWEAVLLRLPADVTRVRQVLISLGALSRTTVPVEAVAETLLQTSERLAGGARMRAYVPTAVIRPGTDQTEIARQPRTSAVVTLAFPEAVVQPGQAEPPRVFLVPATEDPLAVIDIRERLVDAGFAVVMGEPIRTELRTRVSVPFADLTETGAAVAAAIGLSPDSVRVAQPADATVDAQVVVGREPLP